MGESGPANRHIHIKEIRILRGIELMQLKAGQLIKSIEPESSKIGLITKIYQSKPEFVPQAMVYWLYYKDAPIMLGEITQIDTRHIYTGGGFKYRVRRWFAIMQDESGQPVPP